MLASFLSPFCMASVEFAGLLLLVLVLKPWFQQFLWKPKTKEESILRPERAWCHEPRQVPAPRRVPTARPQKTSTSWSWWSWLPFCCLGRDAEVSEAAKGEDTGQGILHPKWCGLRLREPSDPLPSCEGFSLGRPDEALLNDWAGLRCADDERDRCIELKHLVRGVDGPKDAMTLLRFLRARKQNVPLAADMYTVAMKWHAANPLVSGVQLGTVDVSLHREFDSYWQLVGLLGQDREGDCILWEGIGRSVFAQSSLLPDAFFLDHQVHTCVRMQQALDEQTKRDGRPHMYFTIVEDLHGLGTQHLNLDGWRKYSRCARICQDYFPEIVKRVIIVRAPWIFGRIWNIMKHCLDETFRDKIVFINASETRAGLVKYIDSKWVPESLGGDLRVAGDPDCFGVLPVGRSLVPQELIDKINAAYRDRGHNTDATGARY